MKRPKIIFFDMGSTIISSMNGEPFHYDAGFKAVLDIAVSGSGNVSAEQLAEEYLRLEDDRRIRTAQGVWDYTMEIHFSTSLRYLLELHDVRLGISHVEAAEVFWRNRTRYSLCGKVSECLLFLKERNIRLAMITNNLFQDSIVESRLVDMLSYNPFEFIVSSADYAMCKPNPNLFRIALEKAGVSAAEAWHVGDSVRSDVEGAAAVGIYPVWYKPYYAGHDEPASERDCLRADSWQDVMNAIG